MSKKVPPPKKRNQTSLLSANQGSFCWTPSSLRPSDSHSSLCVCRSRSSLSTRPAAVYSPCVARSLSSILSASRLPRLSHLCLIRPVTAPKLLLRLKLSLLLSLTPSPINPPLLFTCLSVPSPFSPPTCLLSLPLHLLPPL